MLKILARLFNESSLTCAFLCILAGASGAYAQIRSGTITGSVTDPSGAIVVGARVAITNTGTNATYATSTTQAGIYAVPYLEDGTYSISISKAGFDTFTEVGLRLKPSQIAKVDAILKAGTPSTKVEVHAAAEQLQTES